MRWDAFLGGTYSSLAWTADCEETINWYWEKLASPGASAPMALYPTPGVTLLSDTVSGSARAHWYENGREFAVLGSRLVEFDVFGAQTDRGAVAVDQNPATISSNGPNGHQLFITSGDNGYIFDMNANTLTQISALTGKSTMGAFLAGFFLNLDASTATLYWSALFDGTSWTTGTDYAQRSLASDPWKALKVFNRYAYLLGEHTFEMWYVVGGTTPLTADPNTLMPYGILAPWSLTVLGETLVWLGSSAGDRICLLATQGLQPQIFSTQPIETAIGSYSYPLSIGDSYGEHGHTFYLLHFDLDGITLAYDMTTQLWHKRGSWSKGQWSALRPRYHELAFNQHRVVDSSTGALYQQQISSGYDADGNVIRRLRRAPALFNEDQYITYPGLQLDIEPGLGNVVDPGSDPQVMLRYSNDAGKTWKPEQMRSAGKIGEYQKRVRFTRLGMARRRAFEVSVTDPIPWRVTGAYLIDPEPGQ